MIWCVVVVLLFGYICVGDDASKREVSTQPKLTVLPRAYRVFMSWYMIVV